ncbi:MAG: serine hydrolase domain-containing protein [Paraglaciecola sp.]|uniref:serine hydrolase domain-containing protein n=1 Tax=Paraglaciecola sp. TaxID=1920173 RepID=UPI003296F777
MKIRIYILLACIIYMPKSAANNHHETQHQSGQNYERQLTKLLSSMNDVTGVPSFSVAVVHKGKLIASVATGFADKKNKILAEPDTTFRLASVSKIIGATMLAELVVNDRLNPDVGIGRYYPELSEKYHAITVRQLLSHTSGMPHYQIKDYDIYDEHFDTGLDAVKTLKERNLLSRPSTEYHYSTHGYTLAGAIYEKITKQPLSISVENFVTRWTGQATPAIENINELQNSSSRLYELSKSGANEIPRGEKSYSVFGAGLYASAGDLAFFGAQVLNKARAQKPFQQLLFTPTATQDGHPVTSRNFKVGFGWRIATDPHGRKVYHHAGATPGARSILAIYPEQDLSIAFLSNSSWISSIDKLVFALAGLYIDEANIEVIGRTKYQISNNGKQLDGTTNCKENQCLLTDSITDYSHWLNAFNVGKAPIKQWPVFAYATQKGQRLLMVNKIGITEFEGKNNTFEANTGKDQIYSIQLISQNSD